MKCETKNGVLACTGTLCIVAGANFLGHLVVEEEKDVIHVNNETSENNAS